MSDAKKHGLGRGLSSLLGEAPRGEAPTDGSSRDNVRDIEIGRIRPNKAQPRTTFDDAAIDELAQSIAERGVLQPILLRPSGGGFEIIAGERRWRAAQKAQLHAIPAIVRDFDEAASAEVALIENIQREDLNAIEEGEGYRQLIKRFGHTPETVARLVNKSRSHIANLLRLLDLPESVRQMLLRGDLTMGHARAILTAPDPERLALQVVAEELTVRQTEALARDARPDAPARDRTSAARPVDSDLAALQRQLGDMLGLRVKVAHGRSGGNVTLHYSSLDQLDMICQRLSGEAI